MQLAHEVGGGWLPPAPPECGDHGREGHRWGGVDTLLLTTRGRRSGRLRRTALLYRHDGDRYLVVASGLSGGPRHPHWYLNLLAHPGVWVQVGAEKFAARARPASDAERGRLWPLMTEIWPAYDRYQRRTPHQIPVVIIERS